MHEDFSNRKKITGPNQKCRCNLGTDGTLVASFVDLGGTQVQAPEYLGMVGWGIGGGQYFERRGIMDGRYLPWVLQVPSTQLLSRHGTTGKVAD